jgi:HK97 family phage prohead protease
VSIEGRILRGYAATWDRDVIGDRIVKGAFASSIARRGPRLVNGEVRSEIKLYYNHCAIIGHPVKMVEDDRGLYIEALIAETSLGDDVLALIESGSLDAMSFAYDVVEYDRDKLTGDRLLQELELYEIGPVDFPCNPKARILGLKSRPADDEDEDTAGVYGPADDEDEEDDDLDDFEDRFARVEALLEELASNAA